MYSNTIPRIRTGPVFVNNTSGCFVFWIPDGWSLLQSGNDILSNICFKLHRCGIKQTPTGSHKRLEEKKKKGSDQQNAGIKIIKTKRAELLCWMLHCRANTVKCMCHGPATSTHHQTNTHTHIREVYTYFREEGCEVFCINVQQLGFLFLARKGEVFFFLE